MKMLALMTTFFAAAACHTAPTATAPTPPVSASPSTTEAATELAGRRAQMIAWLHEYMEAGQYPTDAAGMPRSVFVDDKGVRCPMAELIWRSGHADLVEAVAREHNEVRLSAVDEGPLLAWMQSSGLTRDEINLVQGAADIDYTWIQEVPEQTILARGEVRGRLESAERALRDGTSHSLKVAVAALPNGRIPEVKLSPYSKVVPASALASGPSAKRSLPQVSLAQPRWRRAPRLTLPDSFQVSPNGSVTLAPVKN